jgi:hypothetical protein
MEEFATFVIVCDFERGVWVENEVARGAGSLIEEITCALRSWYGYRLRPGLFKVFGFGCWCLRMLLFLAPEYSFFSFGARIMSGKAVHNIPCRRYSCIIKGVHEGAVGFYERSKLVFYQRGSFNFCHPGDGLDFTKVFISGSQGYFVKYEQE